MVLMFAPESPGFLYSHNRWEELRNTMNFIAWVNGAPEFNHSFDRESINALMLETRQTASFVDVFTHLSTIKNLAVISVNFGVTMFSMYFTLFYTKYLRGSIFENTLMLGIATVLSSLVISHLLRRFMLSTLLSFFHGLNAALAMVLLVYYEDPDIIPFLVFALSFS